MKLREPHTGLNLSNPKRAAKKHIHDRETFLKALQKKKKKKIGIEVGVVDAGAFRRPVHRARSGLLMHFALSHLAKLAQILWPKFTEITYIVQIWIKRDFGETDLSSI